MGILYFVVFTLILEILIPQSKGITSTTCWNGKNGVEYIGTSTMTQGGNTCQAWMSQTPHAHGTNNLAFFPYDQVTGPSNYCRDPGGWSTAGPWCYTMNPSVTFEFCDIPICTNQPCNATGTPRGQSDPSTKTANVDSNSATIYLQKDTTTYSVSCCGTIGTWRFYARNAGTLRLQAWRLNSANGQYKLLGENVYTITAGETGSSHEKNVTQNARISVEEGDLIGWYIDAGGTDVIPYSAGSTNDISALAHGVVTAGNEVDFASATTHDGRDYAIGFTVVMDLIPYFTNTGSTLSITTAETAGSTVSLLTVTDDDTDDVSNLTISIDANTYFDVSGSNLVVKTGLDVGSYNITLRVTDHCGLSGSHILTVNVAASPLDIATLPATTSVSETVTIETLVHNITVTPSGTYTCVFDSYIPTRAEGNPFEMKSSAYTDFGVYLKSGSNVQYNITTAYTLVVNCSGTTTTISETLTVNLDPNNPPTFNNFQSTISINASATPASTVIYNATVTDADNDTVTLTLITDPVTSAFTIGNDGVIQTAEAMTYHQQASYTFVIAASDVYTTVNSSTITVTISDINVKPVLTNVPTGTQSVLENQAVGTEVFRVSYTDGNGDTGTFSANLVPIACNTMYSLDPNNGAMTTLAQFDFETVTTPTCTATITVSDGKNESDASTVVMQVTNVDEPPVIQQPSYLISTAEVVSGTALPNPGIVVTEPEGQTVTLNLNCGADSGYVSINSGTKIITMDTAYDLDTSGVDTYTMTCDLLASDTVSNTATSTVQIVITDYNDNAPVFSSAGYSTTLVEGHSGYGTVVTATAPDGDRTSPNKDVTYSLSSTTHFNIDSSGNVYNTADLSGDAAGTVYSLTITATDGGAPTQTDTASLTITISTTASPATAAASSSSDDGGGFFSDTGNVVFLVITILLLAAVSALAGLMVWKFCGQNKTSSPSSFSRSYNVNNTKAPRPPEPEIPNQKYSVPKEGDRPDSVESGISLQTSSSSGSGSHTADWIKRIDSLRESPRSPRQINVRSLTNKTSLL